MEVTLLLVARLSRAETTWDLLAPFFKRDPAHLSRHFNALVLRMGDSFGKLVDLQHSVPFFAENLGQIYEASMQALLRDLRGPGPLMTHVDLCKVLADGIRQPWARSVDKDEQNVYYSGYTGDHNALHGIVVGPEGLIIGLTSRKPGSLSDMSFQTELSTVLAENEMPALVDGIFSHIAGALNPIPSEDMASQLGISPETCAKYSAVRIAVEWTIGHLKRWFPYAFCKQKMTSVSNRTGILQVSVILYNFIVCLRGSQVSLYTRLDPFKLGPREALDKYLSMLG